MNFFRRPSTTSNTSTTTASNTNSSTNSSTPPTADTNNSNSMSGIFHSLKKAVVKGDARPDVEFLDSKTKFEQYSETVIKLKGNVQSYLQHANSLFITSSQIASDFSTLIDDPTNSHKSDYTATVQQMRQEHQTLATEQVPKITNHFQTQIINLLDEEITRNNEIAKRITRRLELFGECGYYQKKVNELRGDRESRASKGKPESASDIEKFDRNQKKLDEVTLTYNELHNKLMADIKTLWDVERTKINGPIMNAFIKQEKKFASAYGEALNTIQV